MADRPNYRIDVVRYLPDGEVSVEYTNYALPEPDDLDGVGFSFASVEEFKEFVQADFDDETVVKLALLDWLDRDPTLTDFSKCRMKHIEQRSNGFVVKA